MTKKEFLKENEELKGYEIIDFGNDIDFKEFKIYKSWVDFYDEIIYNFNEIHNINGFIASYLKEELVIRDYKIENIVVNLEDLEENEELY